MKWFHLILSFIVFSIISVNAQMMPYSGSFTVGGDANTYYPVIFDDGGWHDNIATVLHIGRSDTHRDNSWHGSLIAGFTYHLTRWGHASNFIDADIKQKKGIDTNLSFPFIGGWMDPTGSCNEYGVVIWLRGNTTYFYHSNYSQNPQVHIQTVQICSEVCSPKTTIDDYVNSNGYSLSNTIWSLGNAANYFGGKVGIGTASPEHKLDVVGTVRAHEILVNTQKGADYVFEKDYTLRSLKEVEQFITENKRLPDMAPADTMIQNGVNMGEMQIKLLQKIEELTLYVIEQEKRIEMQEQKIERQEEKIKDLESKSP